MQKSLLNKLCCPFDKGDLNLTIFNEGDNGEIYEGVFVCPNCNRYYPIIYSIPIMSPDEYRELQLELPILKRWGITPGNNGRNFVLDEPNQKKLLELQE